MPVPQMVCKIRDSFSFPFRVAACTNRKYSTLFSSFSVAQYGVRWTFNCFTRRSSLPTKEFQTESFSFTLSADMENCKGVESSLIDFCFHNIFLRCIPAVSERIAGRQNHGFSFYCLETQFCIAVHNLNLFHDICQFFAAW